MSAPTLHELVEARLEALGMDRRGFYHALGIRHWNKGEAMMDRFSGEDMQHLVHLRRSIASVLGLDVSEIDAAAETSDQLFVARNEAAWRAAFRPHAILTTLRHCPKMGQITISLMAGALGKLRVDFPDDTAVVDWPRHTADGLPDVLIGFGRVTGFVINYTPDRAVYFDRTGRPLVELDRAYIRATRGRLHGIAPVLIGVKA